ncbi:TrbG/VirB9 family P-type conjugative transfer protein [Sphingomonas sp. ac-8]|uniref:TrbG/VirB9 family P-type conjugative transfer protein n=1 Tax=Sphingomonas sp. ac-8 TaxID=3242977 RepID=UPI003A811E0C
MRVGAIGVASGDTARWVIGDTTSGAGDGKQAYVLVKPVAAGLLTNLVITTDRRAYHFQLASTAATALSSIRCSDAACRSAPVISANACQRKGTPKYPRAVTFDVATKSH